MAITVWTMPFRGPRVKDRSASNRYPAGMNQLESRPLRYFVAVAQELNFARAAERIGIAAPALSRAIAKLEAQLGVKLLERSTRHVALTEAGSVLLEQAQIALDAFDAAARRTRRAAEPQGRLVVALKTDLEGGLLEQATDAYSREQPGVLIDLVFGGWGEQPQLLRDGRADVALIYAPFDHRDLDSEVLMDEPQLAALPAAHPLAARGVLRVRDLEAEYQRTTGPYIWQPRQPDGVIHDPPRTGNISRLLRLIEIGQVIALLPASVAARFLRPQISYCPVEDTPPISLSVAWPLSSCSLATAAFVRIISEIAAEQRSSQDRSGPFASQAGAN